LNPSLSNVELVDKCFPSTRRDHVVGYGGGIKARDLRSPAITKAELVEKLAQSEQERQALQDDNQVLHEENRKVNNRMSRMEEEWAQMKKYMSANYSQHDSPGSAVSMDTQKYCLFLISPLFFSADMKHSYCREQDIRMKIIKTRQVNGL